MDCGIKCVLRQIPIPLRIVGLFFGATIFALFSFIIFRIVKKEELHAAARSGNIQELNAILDRHPELLEQTSRLGTTPLLDATISNKPDSVKALIARGANANAKWGLVRTGDGGWTALHIAASGGYTEAAQILIQAGTSINHESVRGQTPLDLAVERGNMGFAQFLRVNGAVGAK